MKTIKHNNVFNIFKAVSFDDSITKYEYHTYHPVGQNFENNDEICIIIQHQDLLTLPSESYIRMSVRIRCLQAKRNG